MQDYPGPRRLDPAADDRTASDRAGRAEAMARRDTNVRQTRRISTWTAAALVASVAASAGYFAHAVATPTTATGGTTVTGTVGSSAASGQKPNVTHPVVTSGGSGVVAGTGSGAGGGSGGAVHWQDN